MKNLPFKEFRLLSNWSVANEINPLSEYLGYKPMFMSVTFATPKEANLGFDNLLSIDLDRYYLNNIQSMPDDMIFYLHGGRIWMVRNGEIDFVKKTFDQNHNCIEQIKCEFPNKPIIYYGRIKTWLILRSIKRQIRIKKTFLERENWKIEHYNKTNETKINP